MSLLIKKAKTITLYHGTCPENAEALIKNGWQPNQASVGGNAGQTRFLYLTDEPENALGYAQEKGCNTLVEVSRVPMTQLAVDPEDGTAETVEEELNKEMGLPGNVVLTQALQAAHFRIVQHSGFSGDFHIESKLHSHASTQIDVPQGVAAKIMEIGRELIPDEYLSGEGRVQELHVTVKYGVQANEQALRQICAQHSPFTGTLGKTQVFVNSENNAGGIPVVVEVRGAEFGDLHQEVAGAMGTIADEFPYTPHITIAYVKENEAQHFAGSDLFAGISFHAGAVILSKNDDDNQVKIPFGQQMTAAVEPELPQVDSYKVKHDQVQRDEPATDEEPLEQPDEPEESDEEPEEDVEPEQQAPPRELPQSPKGWRAPKRPAQETTNFKKWFGKSKVVDDEGQPLKVYHGTTFEIDEFDYDKTNTENFYGKGFYFSSDSHDVEINYATDKGGDITSRIDRRAEEIEQGMLDEGGIDDPDEVRAQAYEMAREQVVGPNQGTTMPVYLSLKNPVEVKQRGGTYFELNYDEETGEESGSGMKLYAAVMETADEWGVDGQKIWGSIFESTGGWSEFTAMDFENAVRELDYIEDSEGSVNNGAFIGDVYQKMGFDGIAQDAYAAFGPRKLPGGYKSQGMPAISPDTTHYIVWDPAKIKSAIGNRGKFDPKSPNITAAGRTGVGDLGLAKKVMHELMPILGEQLPEPELKMVNQPRAGWLGRNNWRIFIKNGSISWDPNTTITIQKYILSDETTLRRIIAHELCHHADALIEGVAELSRLSNFGMIGYKTFLNGQRGSGHGSSWKKYAAKYNAKFGADFVTERSDESYVQEEMPIPAYYIMMRKDGEKIYYSVSSRMTQNIRGFVDRFAGEPNYRITKTTDREFMHAATIGSGWSYPKEGDAGAEKREKVQELWKSAPVSTPRPQNINQPNLINQLYGELAPESKTSGKRAEAVTSLIVGLDTSKYPEFPSPVLVRWEQGMRWRAVLKAVKAIVGVISGKRIPWRSINIWKSPWANYEEQQTGWEDDKSSHNRIMYDVLHNGSYVSVGQVVLPFGEHIDQWTEAEAMGAEEEEPLSMVADSHKVTPLDETYYVNPERGQETNAYADIPERVRGEYDVPSLHTLVPQMWKEGAEGIRYTLDIHDSHRGELFGKVEALMGDDVVGYVQFSEADADIPLTDTRYWTEEQDEFGGQQWAPADDFPRQVHIKYVYVNPKLRRQGIGTGMYQKIQQEFPGEKIVSSGTTDEGGAFRSKLLQRGVLSKLAVYGEAQNQVQHTDQQAVGMSKTLKSDPFAVEVEELHQSMGRELPEPNPVLPTGSKAETHTMAEGEENITASAKTAKTIGPVYHGTGDEFEEYHSVFGTYYFTDDPFYAGFFTNKVKPGVTGEGANIRRAYLTMNHPFDARPWGNEPQTIDNIVDILGMEPDEQLSHNVTQQAMAFWQWLRNYPRQIKAILERQGYDGVIQDETHPAVEGTPSARAYVVFNTNQIKWTMGKERTSALLRKKAVEPYEQTEDEYAGKWNEQETEEQSKQRYQKKREWQQSTLKMLSLGKMSPQDAKQRGLLISTDAEKFKPLPPDLYHVTTARSKVENGGLKTREELGQEYGKGLGGGTSQAISFTTDPAIAKGIYDNLMIARKVAAGEMGLDELISTAQAGSGAKKPWLTDIIRSLGQGEVGEKELDAIKRGVVWTHTMGNPPTEKSIDNTMAQVPSDKWRPTPWSHHWTGGDGQERYSNWERDMNEQEKREAVFEFFKKWSFWREQAGGGLDPLYFMSDPHALGQVPATEIAILHFKPIPGAMGTQESALGEWRTYSGEAVKLVGDSKTGAVSGNAAGKGEIGAHREGNVIHIDWFTINEVHRGKGWGRRAYEQWEASLPKDIVRVELNAAQDAGTGPVEQFWVKMGFEFIYNREVYDATIDNAMWKGVNGHPTPKAKDVPEEYWEEDAERD